MDCRHRVYGASCSLCFRRSSWLPRKRPRKLRRRPRRSKSSVRAVLLCRGSSASGTAAFLWRLADFAAGTKKRGAGSAPPKVRRLPCRRPSRHRRQVTQRRPLAAAQIRRDEHADVGADDELVAALDDRRRDDLGQIAADVGEGPASIGRLQDETAADGSRPRVRFPPRPDRRRTGAPMRRPHARC